jgi:hypothetical protein
MVCPASSLLSLVSQARNNVRLLHMAVYSSWTSAKLAAAFLLLPLLLTIS